MCDKNVEKLEFLQVYARVNKFFEYFAAALKWVVENVSFKFSCEKFMAVATVVRLG